MQTLNKTEQIAHLQGKTGLDRNMAVHDMLMASRDTPHPASGVTPYQAMSTRPIRTKLDHTTPTADDRSKRQTVQGEDGARQCKYQRAQLNGWRLCSDETEESKQMVNCLRACFLHSY